MTKRHISFLFIFLFFVGGAFAQREFVLVIDPGHGGRDPGAVGAISQEKNINLAVALKLGALIRQNHPDVRVIFTRQDDTFIGLADRANIANRNNANLFISIHTNAARNRAATGTETFVFGLSSVQSNMEAAMRENSVILFEDDHETRYEGFDPNCPSSYIMFEFMQSRFRDNSIDFASRVQDNFASLGRGNRGVKEAPFLVLHSTTAPSVLVELGFISNAEEERFMNSERGQNQLARAISDAFDSFKRAYDLRTGNVVSGTAPAANNAVETAASAAQPVFKVQIFSSRTVLNRNDRNLRDLQNVSFSHENGWYRYSVGNASTLRQAQELRDSLQARFPGAFVVAYLGDKRIPVAEAQRMLNP